MSAATTPLTFAALVEIQPKLAKLERDVQGASRRLLTRQRDWYWYEYAKPRLNDLVGLEPRNDSVEILEQLSTMEAHTLAYNHLYAVLWKRKTK